MRSNKRNRLAAADSSNERRNKAYGHDSPSGGKRGFTLGGSSWKRSTIKSSDVTFIFRNLATLLDNGVSLPKAIGALADERGMEGAREVLLALRKMLESGATFSAALAKYPELFDTITVNQVKVGERSGGLAEALQTLAEQREKAGKLRGEIIKKLAYPAMLAVVGCGVIAFLLGYVVPVFEDTYRSAKVPLPGITQTLITVGNIAENYWMFALGGLAVGVITLSQIRKNDRMAQVMDAEMLKMPLIGQWMRDIAVLELMEVIGNLMEAGFTLSDALAEAGDSVGNRAVRTCVHDLQMAVNRGERFSREVERHNQLFPPLVSQLVIVGEQTGNLAKATRHIRSHLHAEIERRSNVFVGIIEPTLTISMAGAVAVILLAIYLPMFDMINTVG